MSTNFTPKTGAVIDRISRPEPLTVEEQRLADWAAERGLLVVFGKAFPLEDDEEQFEPFFTYELGIEEMVNDKIVAHFISTHGPDFPFWFPEMWELQEQMLRLSFERTKEEAARD